MPRMRRNRKRETIMMIGVKRSIVQIICSFVIIENASAMGMINIPIAKITKTAGPSPASSIVKSASQASHSFENVKKPEKRVPSPHSGQRPLSPFSKGELALKLRCLLEDDVNESKEEEPDNVNEVPIPCSRF